MKSDRDMLTESYFLEYAKAYVLEGYGRDAMDRGILVVKIDRNGYEGTPLHYLFQIFKPGTEVPVIPHQYKKELLCTKRLLRDHYYSETPDAIELGKAIYLRSQLKHGGFALSLASSVLGLAECSRNGAPNRAETEVLLTRIAAIDLAHPELLFHPKKPVQKPLLVGTSTPNSLSSTTPMSSRSSERTASVDPSPNDGGRTRLDFTSPRADDSMATDERMLPNQKSAEKLLVPQQLSQDPTATSDPMTMSQLSTIPIGTLASLFAARLNEIDTAQRDKAITILRDELSTSVRHKFRKIVATGSRGDLEDEEFGFVREEVSELRSYYELVSANERRHGNGQPDVSGLVDSSTGTLRPFDFPDDIASKSSRAPSLFAILQAATTSKYHELETRRMEAWRKNLLSNSIFNLEPGTEPPESGYFCANGSVFQQCQDGSDPKEVVFKTHGARWGLKKVESELARRNEQKTATLGLLVDVIYSAHSNGIGPVPPLQLRLSAAATGSMTHEVYDILSSSCILVSRGAATKVVDEFGVAYRGSFSGRAHAYIKAAKGHVVLQYDNLNKLHMNRQLMESGNVRSIPTLTRSFMAVRDPRLTLNDTGLGRPLNIQLLENLLRTISVDAKLEPTGGSTRAWQLPFLNGDANWLRTPIPKDVYGPYRMVDQIVCPQGSGSSASHAVFKKEFVNYFDELFSGQEDVFMTACVDPEMVPQIFALIQKDSDVREKCKNLVVAPFKLHISKHAGGVVQKNKYNILHILSRVLTEVLPTSVAKWKKVGAQAKSEVESAASGMTPEVDDDDDDIISPLALADALTHVIQEIETNEADEDDDDGVCAQDDIAEFEVMVACDNPLHKGDPWLLFCNEQRLANGGLDLEIVKEAEVYNCQTCLKTTESQRLTALTPATMSPQPTFETPEIDAVRPPINIDLKALEAKLISTACVRNRKDLPVALLRSLCEQHEKLECKFNGKWKPRKQLEELLIAELKLKSLSDAAKAHEDTSEASKMSLFKLKQLLYYFFFRWDGAHLGGACLRGTVAQMFRDEYFFGAPIEKVPDNDAIGRGVDSSTFILGAIKFFDVETRLVVSTLVDWEDGNIEPFLRAFPSLCAFIASGHLPKVLIVFPIKYPCNSYDVCLPDRPGVFDAPRAHRYVRSIFSEGT